MTKKELLIIMVTYNAEKYLDKSLTPFMNKQEGWDVFVVDNCSEDNTVSIIESKFPFVNLTKSQENLGFGVANNIGLKYALENEYEHVLLLNQDAYITQECIRNLIKAQKNNPEYYVLSPMQFDSTEKSLDIDFCCFMLENKELTIDALSGIYKKEIYDCRFTPATCWLISLECIKNIGGFNPTFYHYGEDDNYSHRVLFQGKKYGVLPQEKVIHDRLYRPANTKFDEKFKIKYRKWLVNLSNPNNNFVYELYKIATTTLFHFYSATYIKLFIKLLGNINIIKDNLDKSKIKTMNRVMYLDSKGSQNINIIDKNRTIYTKNVNYKNFFEKIFSLKNTNFKGYKVITLLGFKIYITKQANKKIIINKKFPCNGKKNILYIDKQLLQPDTNCGDRASMQYLELLNTLGFNIIFAFHYMNNNEEMIKAMEDKGIQVLYQSNIYPSPAHINNWLMDNGKEIDYIYVNRPECYSNVFKEYAPNAKIIYQGHDIHFLREKRMLELKYSKKLELDMLSHQLKEQDIWDNVDKILYFSNKEIDFVKQYNNHLKVQTVPLFIYETLSNVTYNATERQDLLFCGGFNHSPNKDAVLWFCKEIFPNIQKNIPDIKFHVVGSNPSEEIKNLCSDNIIVHGYVTDEELIRLYNQCRIVIAPLRYGAGVKGKIIEAIYNKIPVVTTNIGIEGINNENGNIFVANSQEEWVNTISNIYNNYQTLELISKKSDDFIMKNYSKEYALKIINEVIYG